MNSSGIAALMSGSSIAQNTAFSSAITAKITDDSGLESVTIRITNPADINYDGAMIRTGEDTFSFVFKDTLDVGTYTAKIEAVDISIHANKATKSRNFSIIKDETPPIVTYFDARPSAQLIDDSVTIICITTDNIGIQTVKVVIIHPGAVEEKKTMIWHPEGKYIYDQIYNITGKYGFYILVEDKAGNKVETAKKVFWITTNKDDTDDDGMPDWWEKKYSLDPENPDDAHTDQDGDGYTNLKEYESGTNPMKDIFVQNVIHRITYNSGYLAASVILFIAIVLLSLYGRRRRSL